MYNRYIPDGAVYTRVTMDDDEPRRPREPERRDEHGYQQRPRAQGCARSVQPQAGLPEGVSSSLKSLISSLGLEKLDSGDLLLFLILLLLLKEGDDLEMIIALGLTLLMGLGEGEEK